MVWCVTLMPRSSPDATPAKPKGANPTRILTELVLAELAGMDAEISCVQGPIVQRFRELLRALEGASFGSLENNQKVARAIRELLYRFKLRVRCPLCGEPALLHCSQIGTAKNGAFRYRHVQDGRTTFHGAKTLLHASEIVAATQEGES